MHANLQAVTALSLFPDNIKHTVNKLSTLSVVALMVKIGLKQTRQVGYLKRRRPPKLAITDMRC